MKDKIIIGYDLGNIYSQISYCTYDSDVPETLSVVTGGENYNIPTMLCKRQGVNQWFYGKDAIKHADMEDGFLVQDLLLKARSGEKVVIEDEEFDPVALLTLFIKRSLTLLTTISQSACIDALMVTCEVLDSTMVDILNRVMTGLALKTKNVCFQGYVESFYFYTLYQPEELWMRQVLVCDYVTDYIKIYRLECNRRTTPVVAFVDEEEFPFIQSAELPQEENLRKNISEQMDSRFLSVLNEVCEGRIISSAYLIGEGFRDEWMKESLRYLCRGKRVFQGNNLYSKGACLGMKEKLFSSEKGKTHVFLGNEKLKANIGMKALRQGEDSYYALMDAGVSWFEAQCSLEFLLDEGNSFSLVITPLNGRDIKSAQVTLDGLPMRTGGASRLFLEMKMISENTIQLKVEDLGFGELFPSSHQKWTESFEVV
ncbi:MAG TPA: DUF5716 family protein [Lachnospiraceae bacterium]|nr:DUF5716 family protein [Lachnospiraceae bacterium]